MAHLVPAELVSQRRVCFESILTWLILAIEEAWIAAVSCKSSKIYIGSWSFLAGARFTRCGRDQLGSGGSLLLLDALVVLDLTVVT